VRAFGACRAVQGTVTAARLTHPQNKPPQPDCSLAQDVNSGSAKRQTLSFDRQAVSRRHSRVPNSV